MPRIPNPYRVVGLKSPQPCEELLCGPTRYSRKRERCNALTGYALSTQAGPVPRCLQHIPADSVGIHREQPAPVEALAEKAA